MASEIVLTEDSLRFISLFHQITHTDAIDCLDAGDKLVFVVGKGKGNFAVGKNGEHMIKLSGMTGGKSIQVVEYSEDPKQFVINVFHMYGPTDVVIEKRGEITHATVSVNPSLKGRAIGKGGKNLRIARDLVSRHHEIQSISVQ